MTHTDEDVAYELRRQRALDNDDHGLSIHACAESLVKLEGEIAALERDEIALATRRKYLNQKLQFCHADIKRYLLKTGVKYEAKTWPKFPELNGG